MNQSTKTLSDSFQDHWQYIYNYAYSRTKRHQLAEDVAQETLFKAWRNRHKYDPKIGRLRTWLYVIANHTLVDHLRLDQDHTLLPDCSGYVVYDETPEDAAIENETAERLKTQIHKVFRALNRDTMKYGTLLHRQFFRGFTDEELAKIHGIALGTVRWRTFRARKLFKEKWQERFAIPKEE